jgi:hypothetical protein
MRLTINENKAPNGETVPVIPDSFLGGSAPRLRILSLSGIPFPGLPKLLLSANHLVSLSVDDIPHSGYISPEAMVALLSVSSSLRSLSLKFRSRQSRPDWGSRSLPPPNRSILLALKELHFQGVTNYLEELVTRIDAPQLHGMDVTFLNQTNFDCPRLVQFINCTPTLVLKALNEAHVQFHDIETSVELRSWRPTFDFCGLQISVSLTAPDWQLSSIGQVCNFSLPSPSTVEDLYIEYQDWLPRWRDDAIENTLWLQLFLPFTAVKNLYLSKVFGPGIMAALQELVGARITEVLPSLQNIFVEGLEPLGPFQENIEQFVAARRHSDHPTAISVWGRASNHQL